MIELTRLNGNPMLLNSDLIKTAEASPDTMLTLINGEKLIVREERSEVLDRVLAYRASVASRCCAPAVSQPMPFGGPLHWPVSNLEGSFLLAIHLENMGCQTTADEYR